MEKNKTKYFVSQVNGENMISYYGSFGDFVAMPIKTACNFLNGVIEERDKFKGQVVELKAENEKLKEFVDKLDTEFGKNVEPTLGGKADNIIALHRTNKAYCEIAQQQLQEKEQEIENLKEELEQTNAGYDFIYE